MATASILVTVQSKSIRQNSTWTLNPWSRRSGLVTPWSGGEKCRSGTLSRPAGHTLRGEQISTLEVVSSSKCPSVCSLFVCVSLSFAPSVGFFHLSPGGCDWEGECFLNNWCASFVLEIWKPFFRTQIVSGASLTFLICAECIYFFMTAKQVVCCQFNTLLLPLQSVQMCASCGGPSQLLPLMSAHRFKKNRRVLAVFKECLPVSAIEQRWKTHDSIYED